MADVDVSVNAVVKVCSASVQLQDVAVIKSQTVTNPSGKFNIVVTNGVISAVTFVPITPPEE